LASAPFQGRSREGNRVHVRSVVGIVLSAVLLAGCGPSAPSAGGPGPSAAAPTSATFTAPTLGGGTFDSASLAGRPAVLWFWAPWCPTCAGQAKAVRALADTYQGKVTVVGVAGMDKAAEMDHFVDIFKLDGMTHLADEQGAVWKRFGIAEQSLYVLLDASGQVSYRGRLGDDELAERVQAMAS
jgi:peroxiredoxin